MKFTYNGEILNNTITDEGKINILHSLFSGYNYINYAPVMSNPISLFFRFIDANNYLITDPSDTLNNHNGWQFFNNDNSLLWEPRFNYFNNKSYIDGPPVDLIIKKIGTIVGLAMVNYNFLLSTAIFTTPRDVKIDDVIQLTYTIDW